jgi:VCBS repeat-containing protein
MLLVVAMSIALAIPQFASASLALLRPDPLVSGTFYGRGGISTDGWGGSESGSLQAEVPAGSTIEQAWLYVAGTPWEQIPASASFAGQSVAITTVNQDQGGVLGRGDVSAIVADEIGSAGGVFDFAVTSAATQGQALAVIYGNPAEPYRTIAILDGGAAPTGDTATFSFSDPIDPTTDGFEATLALGITFSYQGGGPGSHDCGGGQTSIVDVNGQRLTSCAGDMDDGVDTSGLITVGGVGDDTANPPDPSGEGGQDDELYDLVPLLQTGDTGLTVTTVNPSDDDYIFLAAIAITARASVSSTGSPVIGTIADQELGAGVTSDPLAFTVGDAETAATDLIVTAASSDQAVVADGDLILGGSGADRTVTVGAGAAGTATIGLTVTDGEGKSAVSSFVVTVSAVADPPPADPTPTAADDNAETTEDAPLDAATVLANDSDPADLNLTAVLVDDVSHGELTLNADGTFSYSPAANYHGSDSFTYRADNGAQQSASATVTITIDAENDAPVAVDDDVTIDQSATPTASLIDVLTNDTDADGDPLGLTDVGAPTHGTASIVDGVISYTPEPLFQGVDSFTYAIADGNEGSATGTVTVTVTADAAGPTSAAPIQAFVAPATATRSAARVRFTWPAADDRTGVTGYDIQISADGGAYSTVATNTPALSLTRSVALGHTYRVRVRSIDGAGNAGAWATGPSLAVRTWQTPSFRYHGTWRIVLAGTSAGTGYRYSTAKGATASITTTARNYAWLAQKNASSGRAAVYVDGVYVATVNLYSATSRTRQVVFAAAFETRGSHTITIRNLGTAGHSRVNLDSLLILR